MCHFRPKVASLLASGSPNMNPDFNSKLRERRGTKLVWVSRLFHGPPLKGGMGALKKVTLPEHFWAICSISVVENLFQSAAVSYTFKKPVRETGHEIQKLTPE